MKSNLHHLRNITVLLRPNTTHEISYLTPFHSVYKARFGPRINRYQVHGGDAKVNQLEWTPWRCMERRRNIAPLILTSALDEGEWSVQNFWCRTHFLHALHYSLPSALPSPNRTLWEPSKHKNCCTPPDSANIYFVA
jgi:hypothetical protein